MRETDEEKDDLVAWHTETMTNESLQMIFTQGSDALFLALEKEGITMTNRQAYLMVKGLVTATFSVAKTAKECGMELE
jgi:hypothetical protein